jgi:hypothetical protein
MYSRVQNCGEDSDQQHADHVRRVRESEAESLVEIVGRRLADRRREDLDDPEVDGDLGDLVQHQACCEQGRLWLVVAGAHVTEDASANLQST